MNEVYRYAYGYRNPRALKIVLAQLGLSRDEAKRKLLEGLSSYEGHRGLQYNYLTGSYQTLSEWIAWYFRKSLKERIVDKLRWWRKEV